jgi:hypothetical protein
LTQRTQRGRRDRREGIGLELALLCGFASLRWKEALFSRACWIGCQRDGASRQDFESHRALEGELDGLVDHPHPPAPDLADDLKVAQALSLGAHDLTLTE